MIRGERPQRVARHPDPLPAPPVMPGWLPADAGEMSAEVAGEAEALGARRADSVALAALCMSAATLRRVAEQLAGDGLVVAGEDGDRKHPLLQLGGR